MKTNKTTQQAHALLERATDILSERYNFDGPGSTPMHSVNVKRYNDAVDEDERATIAHKVARAYNLGTKHEAAILAFVNEYAENNDAYWQWLEGEWDYMNYAASDPEVCGMKYVYIHTHAYNTGPMIVQRGRSGGHACFNSDLSHYVDVLEDTLDRYQHGDEGYAARDVRDDMQAVRDTMEEIEHLQAFIVQHNNALAWSDELTYRAEEHADELRASINKHTATRKAQIANNAPLLARA